MNDNLQLDVLAQVNAYELSPALLMGAMEVIAELPDDDRRSFEGRTFAIIRYVAANIDGPEKVTAVLAINFRLEALARLDLAAATEWHVPGSGNRPHMLHHDVTVCAAQEPVVDGGDGLRFDRDSFHRRLLGTAEPGGSA